MKNRLNAAFLGLMIAAAIHRREGDPHQPRRILIDVDENEDTKMQTVSDLRPPLSPVRLIDGRWVNDDETTPERRYTAEDEHPGADYRNFPCLPLPEEPTPTPKD